MLLFRCADKGNQKLTSTLPRMTPAPMVPMPAIKNGIDTCIVVRHHTSCWKGVPLWAVSFSSPFSLPSSPPPTPHLSGSGSEEATVVVMIELNEPVVEVGSADNLSLSLSAMRENRSVFIFI